MKFQTRPFYTVTKNFSTKKKSSVPRHERFFFLKRLHACDIFLALNLRSRYTAGGAGRFKSDGTADAIKRQKIFDNSPRLNVPLIF